jgi:hypothetical protein
LLEIRLIREVARAKLRKTANIQGKYFLHNISDMSDYLYRLTQIPVNVDVITG